jgi:FtsP/CotA-like multicopper oxidase with cupredoxin domain
MMSAANADDGHLEHGEAIPDQGAPAASADQGGQPAAYTQDGDMKVFSLTTRIVKWNILPEVTVAAMTYNGTVPGPMIRVTEGDKVRVLLKNDLPFPTTIHWHGVLVPNEMDGVPDMTQEAVPPGGSFTYEFTAAPAGTFWYHSHFETDSQVLTGLYAPFVIDSKTPAQPQPDMDVTLMLSEWRVVGGQTFPAMPMAGMEPNFFTINGKAYPATETVKVKLGQRVRLRFVSAGQFVHPMHLHGMPFRIVATDGNPVPEGAQWLKDTVSVAPGERYDVEFIADRPGQWMVHCHIPHHTTNDGKEPGGLMMVVEAS